MEADPTQGAAPAPQSGSNATLPVVIVDDNEDDLLIARRCYERAEMPCPLATYQTPDALLDYLDEVEVGRALEPKVVLLDVQMAPLSGLELLECLRTRSELGARLRVVMFSSSNDPRDIKRALELGANGFVTKPMSMGEYVEVFKSLVD